MLLNYEEIGYIEKGNILSYVSIKDTYKIKKGYVVDVHVKDNTKPSSSTYIKLKSLHNNFFWEINTLKHMYLKNKKPMKRRSDFKIMIQNYLKK